MRKHFLILMLLALLPFTAWADDPINPTYPVDLSDGWAIKFSAATATYTGGNVAPTITLTKTGYNDIPATKFNVQWSSDPVNVGNYTVTVTANNSADGTYESLHENTKKFYVLKANAVIDPLPAKSNNTTYSGNPYPLISNYGGNDPVHVNFGTVEYSINGGTWSSDEPTATMPGSYVVQYRVLGTDNYNGIPASDDTKLAAVTIAGTPIEDGDYTAPTELSTALTFKWENGAKVEQELINAGTVAEGVGIMKYGASATGPWSTFVPKKADANPTTGYPVYWMIEGINGHADKAAAYLANVTIAKKTPTVGAPTGNADLEYQGDASAYQDLLASASDVSDGAEAKYLVRYKSYTAASYGEWSTAKSLADVEGKAAGYYQVKPVVEVSTNYNAVTPADAADQVITVEITRADAYTAAPTAADLTWNNDDQVLINAAAGAVTGKVLYSMNYNPNGAANNGTWVSDINNIKAKVANDYPVYFKVTDANYKPKAETLIENVKIKKRELSVKVNDVTKEYDGTVTLTDASAYSAEEAAAYNAQLPGALNSYEPLSAAQVELYNTAMTATKEAGVFLTAVEAKAYNATLTGKKTTADLKPANYTIDGDAKFTFITRIDDGLDFSGLDYDAIANSNKTAGPHADALTVTLADLETISTNYEYTIIPGKLTVTKAPLTVYADGSSNKLTTMYGTAKNISNAYTVIGYKNGESANDAFTSSGKPSLTSNAPAQNPDNGAYTLSFNKGTLKSNGNYTMSTLGENGDGYVIGNNKFIVTPDPDRKIVITVLPQTQKYTGVAESWANPQEGVHYLVSGLVSGEHLTKAPTLTRSDATNFNASATPYTLTASGAEVADITKYPGGFVYNNSTFTIEPAELEATVTQQTLKKGATALPTELPDANAWDVTGLVGSDATTGKSVLGGTLAINTTEGTDPAQNDVDEYENGIKLTITNTNYVLKAGTQWGTLRVIAATTLELDPTIAIASKIEEAAEYCKGADHTAGTADDQVVGVTFAHKTLKADTWYTMVLPFAVKATELVNEMNDGAGHQIFTITNRLNEATTTGKLVFKLEMKEIPANEPFLIKTAEDVDLQDVTFTNKFVVYNATPESPAYDSNKLIGTYSNIKIQCPAGSNVLKWLVNEETEKPAAPGTYYDVNNWKVCRDYEAPINALEAYLKENRTVEANAAHPTIITVEDFDGQTTSIKTLNADTMKAYAAEGWYTVNGIKLQGAPTEKGIYINNGKKVVLK